MVLFLKIFKYSETDPQFTFDFLMLLVLASMIAFMGLIENSTVVLVASMLVSPIMGPILAGIFGSVVGDAKWDNQLHVVLLDSTPEIEAFVSLLIYTHFGV